jgi:hypothetical protein
MNSRFFIIAFVLITYMGTSHADDLELSLERCLSGPAQVTDIEFIAPHYAFMTTQLGDIYWFRGCDRRARKIGHIDVAMSDWRSGLYSIAVPHDFFWSHTLFLYYTAEVEGAIKTRLSSFKMNLFGDKGLSDETVILEIDMPDNGNYGGALTFGPDGLLYLGVGDGGPAGDPDNNAQNVENLLGSIVRIRPDADSETGYSIPDGNLQDFVPDALPEIFAYGVHNPWKMGFSYDGSLILGDVGEDTIEEIDILSGEMMNNQEINLGWNIKEGQNCFNQSDACMSEDLVDPVYQYEHGNHGNAIIGGETYVIGDKEYYIFADFMTGMLGVLDLDDPTTPVLQDESLVGNWVTFARTPFGRVYVADYEGNLYRVLLK